MIRLLLVYRYCTLGGVETGIRSRLELLPRHGIEADALFFRDYGGWKSFANLHDRAYLSSRKEDFLKLLREREYDIISVVDTLDVLEWIREAPWWSGALMFELRSTYDHTLQELSRLEGHRVDAFVVPSHFQATNVEPHLPKRLRLEVPRHVVPNFIPVDQFPPAERYAPADGGAPVVAWVGRIDPLKNWSDFLAIGDRLLDRRDVELWMVGGGRSADKERERFRRSLDGRPVAGALRWWPLLPRKAMPGLYRELTGSGGIVLLTTRNESFGYAALEAMAAGAPLVTARVGALPELVRDGVDGLLYPSGDVEKAAELALDLLGDPDRRKALGRAAAARVREKFDPERCLATFAEVVQLTVERRRGDASGSVE